MDFRNSRREGGLKRGFGDSRHTQPFLTRAHFPGRETDRQTDHFTAEVRTATHLQNASKGDHWVAMVLWSLQHQVGTLGYLAVGKEACLEEEASELAFQRK